MSSRTRATTLILSLTLLGGATVVPAATAHTASDPGGTGLEVTPPRPAAGDLDAVRDRVAAELEAGSSQSGVPEGWVNPVVDRVHGVDRYATAAELSRFWSDVVWADTDESFPVDKLVFVASGTVFADALSGGAMAGAYGGPILLTRPGSLPKATAEALSRLAPDHIVVLGGTAAVSTDVEDALRPYASSPEGVSRIDGADRYEVSARIAQIVGPSSRAFVASGADWPDGLAGAAAAGWESAPLLLTKPDRVPQVVLDTLAAQVQPEEIVLLGGPKSISDQVLRQLRTVAPVYHLWSHDRYATAALLAAQTPSTMGSTMVSGLNWPDALAGSAFAGLTGDKLLLLQPTKVPEPTAMSVTDLNLAWITVLGGPAVLPEPVLAQLRTMVVEVPSVQ